MEEVLEDLAVDGRFDVWSLDEIIDEQLISELLNDDDLLGGLPHGNSDSDQCCRAVDEVCAPAAASHGSTSSTATSRAATMSSAYTGPTIRDIEKALSLRCPSANRRYGSPSLFGAWGSRPAEKKHTLKVKSCGGKVPSDGYKWRKYGQKSIKNNPHPRHYYKCTNARCSAKKQVEKSKGEPDTLLVTYEGVHLHYPQPFFPQLQSALVDLSATAADHIYQAAKQPQLAGASSSQVQNGLLQDVVPLPVRKHCDIAPSPFQMPSSSPSPSSTSNSSLPDPSILAMLLGSNEN